MTANPTMSLNEKQLRFVDEYLIDLNATRAARDAGYSSKTAHAQGHRLLNHAEVSAEIERRMAERADEAGVTAQEVIDQLVRWWRMDGTLVYRTLKERGVDGLAELPEYVRAGVSRIVETDGGALRVYTVDKERLSELLMKHLGILDSGPLKVEVTHKTAPETPEEAQALLDDIAAGRSK